MTLLVMPACALNFLYVLIFTILLSPNVSNKVFQTEASVNAINLADAVISPGVPFLIAFALAVIGLKHLTWKHSTGCKLSRRSFSFIVEDVLIFFSSHGRFCADERLAH